MLTSLLQILTQKRKIVSLHCKQLYESTDKREYSVGRHRFSRAWYGMEDDFSIFHTGNFLPFQTKIFFHILFHTSMPKKLSD